MMVRSTEAQTEFAWQEFLVARQKAILLLRSQGHSDITVAQMVSLTPLQVTAVAAIGNQVKKLPTAIDHDDFGWKPGRDL